MLPLAPPPDRRFPPTAMRRFRRIVTAALAGGLAAPALALDSVWFGGNGAWEDAAHWSPALPAADDHAHILGGLAELSQSTSIAGLSMAGGALAGSGNLTVTGAAWLDGGRLGGSGSTRFEAALNLVGDGNRSIDDGRLVIAAGITEWGGNSVANGNALLSTRGVTLRNTGRWNDTNAFDTALGAGSGNRLFENRGQYVKRSSSTTSIQARFDNSGALRVEGGQLRLAGGGTDTGSTHVAGGAALWIGGGGNMTFNRTQFSGSGELRVDAPGNLAGGALFIGELDHAGLLSLVTGSATVDNTLSVASYRQLGGTLDGNGELRVRGPASLDGGSQSGLGTTRFDGSLSLAGNGTRFLNSGRTVETGGSTYWGGNTAANGNSLQSLGGSTIRNTGTWTDANTFDSTLGLGSGQRHFDNVGTYDKAGASVTGIFSAFNTRGTLNVRGGRLNLVGGGLGSGNIHIANGAMLSLGDGSGGQYTFDHAALSGEGELRVLTASDASGGVRFMGQHRHAGLFSLASGEVTVDDALAVSRYRQTGGTLAGPGSFRVSGGATLDGGVQGGPGHSQFDGELAMIGNGTLRLADGRTLDTAGTTRWSGNRSANGNALEVVNGATIHNAGTWIDGNAFDTSLAAGDGDRRFVNAGTYRKLGESTTTIHARYINTGITRVEAGMLSFAGGLDNSGTLAGLGRITLPASGFVNEGVLTAGSGERGTLELIGDLGLGQRSVLEFELAGADDHDRMVLDGQLALAGGLSILNLGYVPVVGDSFMLMSFNANVGEQAFETVRWSGFGDGVVFDVQVHDHDIMLAVSAVPEPAQYATLLAGLALVWVAARRLR